MHKSFILFRSLLFFLVINFATPAVAQHYAGHNWYFGNSSQAIRFNRSDNSASLINSKAIPFGTGGSAVATDPLTGNLLFYTDGANVYDVSNTVMLNGASLNANTTENQPVAICKVPGSTSRYYIFTRNAAGSLHFTVVDMSIGGTFPNPTTGDVLTSSPTAPFGKNVPVTTLPSGLSEAMIIVPHVNREDFWLITHNSVAGAPNYQVSPITATGIGTPLLSGVGLIEQALNFSFHAASRRIAVVPEEDNRDIELLTFDNSTGILSSAQAIPDTDYEIYDTEWSNNGQYLYVSREGEAGLQADVIQYDVTNNFATGVPVLPQPNTIFRSFGLQMAPDSAIYHLYQTVDASGPFLLGKLTNTDTVASEVIYNLSAFPSNTNFAGTQFSSFAPKDSVLLRVTFTSQGTCSNAPTSFFPTVTPAADSLVWNFGDGTRGAGWSPVHTYEAGGAYNVRVRAYLKGDTAGFAQVVNITQFDLQLELVQDTTACVCELPVNNGKPTSTPGVSCPADTSDDMAVTVTAQGGSPTYQWFGPGGMLTGQTTATLRPDSAGYYYVAATVGGCTAFAGVNIKEYDSLDQRANIWHFGQHAGIDFNGLPNDPVVAIRGPLDTPEGCSVISDRNGQVIFSTDGQVIYIRDPNNPNQYLDITPAPNPPGLGGQPGSTQSALIMPVPGDETLFYIFTTQEVHGTYTYELRYSLFDLKLNNGQGGLAEYNKLLFSRSTERITGSENWLIAHEYGNNSFRAYSISPEGISNPVISSIGSDHSLTIAENGQGYMKLGAQNRLAVALSTPGVSNVVEVFDFVDSTGRVTNFRTANLNNPAGQVYGIEISPGGNKLFATLKNASSQVYEFAFDAQGRPYRKQVVNQTGELGAMQIGPDGQIYVAINGSSSLGTFSANEDTTSLSAITTLQPFALAAGTTSELGLPNFTQIIANPTQSPGFTFNGLCLGDSTRFSATGKDPAIDKFDWFFGDGNSVTDGGPEVAHLYAAPGTYTVNVRIYNKCEQVGTYNGTVVIRDVPPDPTTAVPMCFGDAVLDANPDNIAGFSYAWSTGETTETITVSRQAFYEVTVTDNTGCSTDGRISAVDNRPQVEFGPDLTICQNVSLPNLPARNPGATFEWTLNGVNTGITGPDQPVDTSLPGLFEYKVLVTDPVTGCFRRDSITYTINESPAFTAIGNTIACGANNGQVTLNITAPATSRFTYFVTGPGTSINKTDQSIGNYVETSPPNAMTAGTYGISVQDQVSGCATTTTASIVNNNFTVGPVTPVGTCDPITLNVTVAPGTGPINFPLTYNVIDNNSLAQIVETGPAITATFGTDAAGLPSNNRDYIVEVRDPNGCLAVSSPVTVDEAATVPVTFTPNPCINPITITANGGSAWTWTGPNISGSTTSQTITATPPQGDQTYNVTITQAGFCDLDTAITVNVNNDVTADFTQSDACEDQVILSATPAGPYTYRWYRDGTPIPGGGGQQIMASPTDNGITYQVEVVNTLSGCIFPSAPKLVNVAGDIQLSLSVTPPCEGSPFTITATPTPTTITTLQWTLNNVAIPNQTSTTLVDTRAGTYTGTINLSGCIVSDELNIVPAPVTPGLLQDKGIICPDPANPDLSTKEIILNPGPDFTSYNWFKEEVPLGETSPTYTATEAGTFSVDLINSFGCASSDQIILEEECDPRITGPNAFRPTSNVQESGEFTNRDFRLFTFFIDDTDFEIFIFNRWGEMVYQTTDRDFRWNGGYNNNIGQPLPPGTYSYLVRYKSSYRPEEGVREKRGGVVLLR